MSNALPISDPSTALRPPSQVMRLSRMGAAFPTRLSFMRSLIRRMAREGWRVTRTRFALDDEGFGKVVYQVETPDRIYALVGHSHYLEPERRTDRVIAEAWDATFTLYDGVPDAAAIERLSREAPKQEAGRFRETDLVLSRANKSLRLFEHVVGALSQGRQPDPSVLAGVGYLMRTTAVYGNGKFGMADRTRYIDREALAGPFRAELLTVYLIRCFTLDLVEHLARRRDPDRFVPLDPALKRYLGIGNATGLGMAPFLVSHPALIHNWYQARETALARVRALPRAGAAEQARFRELLARARDHVAEWAVEDAVQSARIEQLRRDLASIAGWLEGDGEGARDDGILGGPEPWDRLYRRAEARLSVEAQELLLSLLLEPYGPLVDDLAEGLEANEAPALDATMPLMVLRRLIAEHYDWALAYDFDAEPESRHFWYYSEEKLEPRRGARFEEPGAEKEMPLAVARDLQALDRALAAVPESESLGAFLLRHPALRHVVRRVQLTGQRPYAEIRDNLIGGDCRPIDILRSKLAYFGASKFDPKSDLWTRITLYQGAPLADELDRPDVDDWCFPTVPVRP